MSWLKDNFGAIANIGGGLLDFAASKKAQKIGKQQFRQQMDESIQRRVADAEKAGVHPLFALGASVGASPTAITTGSGLGDAVRGAADAMTASEQRKYQRGQKQHERNRLDRLADAEVKQKLASANRDEAEAQLFLSRRKRLEEDLISRGHDGARIYPEGKGPGAPSLEFGPINQVRPDIKAHQPKDPSTTAGRSPAFNEVYVGGGYTMKALDDEKVQADAVTDVMAAWQLAQIKFRQWRNKKSGIFRLQGPDGKWRSYRLAPSRRGRRRGHGARRR